ncbi:MAG: DUF3047 domain-containing protein [Candidatus Rokubacteria bacterium]|nr:DUF3047 domain-containing protein [Candidatus Rokubacteria bacterium]
MKKLCRILPGLILALATVGWAQPGAVVVEDWSKHEVGATGIPEGWKGQNWGSPAYDLAVVAESPTKVLHLKSRNEGSMVTKEVKVNLRETPILEWQWKVVVLPTGGDSRKKATDDQAAQLYVTFPRFPSAVRSRIIGYVWDTTVPEGTIVPSQKTSLVTYVVVRSGTKDLNRWLTESRNVYEDYKRIYNEEPEEVGAVSIAIDSNDTKSSAESFMGEIRFTKP